MDDAEIIALLNRLDERTERMDQRATERLEELGRKAHALFDEVGKLDIRVRTVERVQDRGSGGDSQRRYLIGLALILLGLAVSAGLSIVGFFV